MRITVDGESNFELTGEPADALGVLGAVNEWLRERGRSMVSVRVDGEALSPDTVLAQLEGRALDTVNELEVLSTASSVLVEEELQSIQEVLPELPKACRELAKLFHSETPAEAYEPFTELAALWRTLKDRQRTIARALHLDLEAATVEGQPLSALHEDLNQYLREAVDALEADDRVLLGDLLEYELAPRAEREQAIIDLLRAEAATRAR